jgi:hypothetical protein
VTTVPDSALSVDGNLYPAPMCTLCARTGIVEVDGEWRCAIHTPAPTADGDHEDLVDLMATSLPALTYVVDGIIPAGFGIVASGPKVGKSLLTVQVCVAAYTGDDVFGRSVPARPVRMYSLEDGRRVIQARTMPQLAGRPIRRGLDIRYEAPRLGSGLEGEIDGWLTANPNGLVWVDMLAKVRPANGRSGGKNAYDEDYDALGPLHKVARSHPKAAVLVNTHDRKAGSDDWTQRITGTRGVAGACDFLLFIDGSATEVLGDIHISGKEIDGIVLRVRREFPRWVLAREESGLTFDQQEVYDVLREAWRDGAGAPTWAADIARQLPDTSRQSVQNILTRLADYGAARRVHGGWIPVSMIVQLVDPS